MVGLWEGALWWKVDIQQNIIFCGVSIEATPSRCPDKEAEQENMSGGHIPESLEACWGRVLSLGNAGITGEVSLAPTGYRG